MPTTLRIAQEAEVLCVLYQRLGTTLLPKLRGEFAFVIYDSKTVSCCMAWQAAIACCPWQAVSALHTARTFCG